MKKNNLYLFLMSLIFTVWVSVVFSPFAFGAEAVKPVNMEELEKQIEEMMEDADIPGASLVIVKADQAVYKKGFGYADLEKQVPVTSQTLFQLASCSKSFTALAFLRLVDGSFDGFEIGRLLVIR